MKRPIFSESQRTQWLYPEIEVAKLKFKRDFMKTGLGRLIENSAHWLSKKLPKKDITK